MGFNVTVTPIVQEVEISANVTPYEVQVTANQDLIDYVNEAKQSADEAEASAISADNSADSALASATSATASANSATSSASSASSSASTATTQTGIATTKANEASQSASNALASEQASAISEANALQSEQNALASEQSALASANTATSQAGIATTKAGEASASASSALASQNSATASANTATTQAGIATTQASNALASANAAAASAASAAQVGTSTLLTGFSVGANTAIAGTDSILQAFNKTQGQINARVSSNIYSANGTLAGARTLTLGGFSLDFIGTVTSRFFANGNIGIGTTTDAGFRLDVNGTARVTSDMTVNGLTIGRGGGNSITSTILGNSALASNISGIDNTAIGSLSLINISSGSNNVAFGRNSGRFIGDATTANTISNNSIFIGWRTKPLADNQTNQLVIGYDAVGLGSNTTVIGNSSTTFGRWWGNLLLGTSTNSGFLLDVNGTARFSNDVTIADTRNIILSTTTGTRIGTATNQRLSLWNATPNVQPTNAITAAAFVANTSGIVNDTATFGGYTIGQIVAALQRIGALA